MKMIHWEAVADSLVFGNWGTKYLDEATTPTKAIKTTSDERLALILLLDIAKSLRVLRCKSFQEIPAVLREIKANTKKKKPKKK